MGSKVENRLKVLVCVGARTCRAFAGITYAGVALLD
jgi:hypothetical protein